MNGEERTEIIGIPIARPMPLFAPVTAATLDSTAIVVEKMNVVGS
jgi:hypothetical protein